MVVGLAVIAAIWSSVRWGDRGGAGLAVALVRPVRHLVIGSPPQVQHHPRTLRTGLWRVYPLHKQQLDRVVWPALEEILVCGRLASRANGMCSSLVNLGEACPGFRRTAILHNKPCRQISSIYYLSSHVHFAPVPILSHVHFSNRISLHFQAPWVVMWIHFYFGRFNFLDMLPEPFHFYFSFLFDDV